MAPKFVRSLLILHIKTKTIKVKWKLEYKVYLHRPSRASGPPPPLMTPKTVALEGGLCINKFDIKLKRASEFAAARQRQPRIIFSHV